MKKHIWKVLTLALILSISAVLVSAGSSSLSSFTTFDVNFDFQIGNKKFSKGKYKLRKYSQGVLLLDNTTAGQTKILIGMPSSQSCAKDRVSVLTFNRYGDSYFIREVVSPTISVNNKMSKGE